MAWMVVAGLFLGAIAVVADVWITQALLGFDNPYIVFSLAVMAIFAITGAFRDNSLPMVLAFQCGVIVGVLATNTLRVVIDDQPSILTGVGL